MASDGGRGGPGTRSDRRAVRRSSAGTRPGRAGPDLEWRRPTCSALHPGRSQVQVLPARGRAHAIVVQKSGWPTNQAALARRSQTRGSGRGTRGPAAAGVRAAGLARLPPRRVVDWCPPEMRGGAGRGRARPCPWVLVLHPRPPVLHAPIVGAVASHLLHVSIHATALTLRDLKPGACLHTWSRDGCCERASTAAQRGEVIFWLISDARYFGAQARDFEKGERGEEGRRELRGVGGREWGANRGLCPRAGRNRPPAAHRKHARPESVPDCRPLLSLLPLNSSDLVSSIAPPPPPRQPGRTSW